MSSLTLKDRDFFLHVILFHFCFLATSSNSMAQMRQQNGEVVLFEKRPSTGNTSNHNGKIYKPKGTTTLHYTKYNGRLCFHKCVSVCPRGRDTPGQWSFTLCLWGGVGLQSGLYPQDRTGVPPSPRLDTLRGVYLLQSRKRTFLFKRKFDPLRYPLPHRNSTF